MSRTGAASKQENTANQHHLPRFHAHSFLLNLQREIAPLAKAHYYTCKHTSEQLTLVRISLHSTPYSTKHAISSTTAANESAKSIFLAFPHSTPYVYISLPTLTLGVSAATSNLDIHEARSVQTYVVKAIPRALSRVGQRYELTGTQLAARGLGALLKLRGNGRTNAAAGAWSVYIGEYDTLSTNLGIGTATKKRKANEDGDGKSGNSKDDDKENLDMNTRKIGGLTDLKTLNEQRRETTTFQHAKPTVHLSPNRRRTLTDRTEGRFGISALSDDEANIQRFDVKIEDPFSSQHPSSHRTEPLFESWTPSIKLSFQGAHVFAGLRKLAECGIIDPEKMPGWLTGEAGVSVGVVKGGRMEGYDELEAAFGRGSGKEA